MHLQTKIEGEFGSTEEAKQILAYITAEIVLPPESHLSIDDLVNGILSFDQPAKDGNLGAISLSSDLARTIFQRFANDAVALCATSAELSLETNIGSPGPGSADNTSSPGPEAKLNCPQ